jgi:1-phosphofructokinase family hexose kinase
MAILTITCNPAIDTTYVLNRLVLGEINRVDQVLPAPGGKGNNVARVLAALGDRPIATGFVGGTFGQFIVTGLQASGVEPAFLTVPGESRTCLTVTERASGRTTEIREPGTSIDRDDADHFLAHVRTLAGRVGMAAVSGSLPPGLEPAFYARLIHLLRETGVYVALDSSGTALKEGMAGGPNLMTPNREELAELVGSGSTDALIDRCQRDVIGTLLPPDAQILLTLGSGGAVLIQQGRSWSAAAPRVQVANTVGSGDALLAGYLHARSRSLPSPDALRTAVAVGSAAAMQPGIGVIDPRDIAGLESVTIVRERHTPRTVPPRPPSGGGTLRSTRL